MVAPIVGVRVHRAGPVLPSCLHWSQIDMKSVSRRATHHRVENEYIAAPRTPNTRITQEMSRQWATRGNRGGRRSEDGGDDVSSGDCGGASRPPRARAGASGGLGNSTGAKGKVPGGARTGAAASSGDKENSSFFDLT